MILQIHDFFEVFLLDTSPLRSATTLLEVNQIPPSFHVALLIVRVDDQEIA